MTHQLVHCTNSIRAKASELREQFGDAGRAQALEWAAGLVEAAIRKGDDEELSLSDAAQLSGYSTDHLARLIRNGKLPNAGRARAPRIRRCDLPLKREKVADVADVAHISGASAVQVARSLVKRG